VGTPRIAESSLHDNGLNVIMIAPKTLLMLAKTSGSWTSENACSKIWEYRESMPAHPSCFVLSVSETTSWRRLFGSWYADSMNLTKVEAKMNSPDDFLVRATISSS